MFNFFKGSSKEKYVVKSQHTAEGNGFMVIRREDKQALRWQSLPVSDGLFSVNVAGTSHRSTELQDKSFVPGKELLLVREPDNPHDENAIAVFNKASTVQIGYLPKEAAKRFSKKLQAGEKWSCYSIWEIIKKGQRLGLRVLLVAEGTKVKGLP